MSEKLPALLDVERLKRCCNRIGLHDAPIFDEPQDGEHPTDRIAQTWMLLGALLALKRAKAQRRTLRRRGRPKKIRTQGLIFSNEPHEQRAVYLDWFKSLSLEQKDLSDREAINLLKNHKPIPGEDFGPLSAVSIELFKHGDIASLAKSVSRERTMMGRPAKRGRPRKG